MSEDPSERIAPRDWMSDAPTRAVLAALAAAEGDPRFVGGCVRDTLLGLAIRDIDIATPLRPEEVVRRLEAAGLKAVPTGIAHGTVTAVAPPRHFEVTTLRRDVETFGRRAKVDFAAGWAEDARRRDFTMNALFLDGEGRVFDYVGGLADLRAARVRFVGDPQTRIREDVLRLLRFYRFFAHYARPPADAAARAACRELAPLLPTLSGERVAAELLKLMAAPDPLPTLAMMREDGVLAILLPEAPSLDRLGALVALEPEPQAIRRLAALLAVDAAGALAVAARLRFANAERDRLAALAERPSAVDPAGDFPVQRRALHHLGAELYRDLLLLRAAETGDAARLGELLALAAEWRPLAFPLKGRDVRALGVAPGPGIGRLLAEVEAWWEAGDFRADRAQCLAELKRRIAAG